MQARRARVTGLVEHLIEEFQQHPVYRRRVGRRELESNDRIIELHSPPFKQSDGYLIGTARPVSMIFKWDFDAPGGLCN